MIRLHLFGRVDLRLSDGSEPLSLLSQPKPLALLAYLAAASPAGYRRREELLAVFWPELDSTRGRRALSQALHVLRSSLDDGAISTRGIEDLGVNQDVVSCDVVDFRTAVSAGGLENALSLYQGDLLSGFFIPGSPEFDQWLDRERATLRSSAAEAAWRLSEKSESDGNAIGAKDWARRAIEREPYNEEGLRRLMRLLGRSGNPAEAIKAYDEYRARVGRELELEPSTETQELAEKFRDRRTPVARRSAHSVSPEKVDPSPAISNAVDTERRGSPPEAHDTPRGTSRRFLWMGLPLVGVAAAAAFVVSARTRAEGSAAAPASAVNKMIVADFTSDAADSALGSTVTEAIKLDLSGSHLIEVVSESKTRDALVLMRRDTSTRIRPDVAREIAVREGIKAVLQGDVRRAGGAFALTARLVSADDGRLIGGWRSSAKDSTELLQAINSLSSAVRRGAGESLKAIAASSPILHVSTTSLDALRKHAMASSAYYDEDFRRASSLFQEAIDIDSTFVDAYMMLSVSLLQLGTQPSRQVEATLKAYRYRDRLGPAERYNVEASYLLDVKGDGAGAIAAMNNAAEIDPSIVFWGRLATQLIRERRYRDGELAALRGLQWTPNPFLYRILAAARYRQGKFRDASETIDAGAKLFPNSLLFPTARIEMAEATRHYQLADSLAHAMPRNGRSTALLLNQGLTDVLVGKTAEAKTHLGDLRRLQMSTGMWEQSIRTLVQIARIDLDILQDTSRAISVLDRGAAESHWGEIDARERPYLVLAHFFLEAGRPERAASLMDEENRNVGPDYRARGRWLRRRDKAMLRVSRGDRSAIDDLRLDTEADPTPTAALADLFWAYRKLGDRKGAESAASAFMEELSSQRLEDDAFNLTRMLEYLKGG